MSIVARTSEMANKWSGASIREFQAIFRGGAVSGMTDRQLLERFAERRDEAAFAGLIDRHASMVWGVCGRTLSDPADVGDAFQATFLVLVRRAGSVRIDESLGPWLYGVSVRVAKRARVVAIRRRKRERTNAELPERPARDAAPQNDLRPLIDEELQQLPPRYRSALILCDLEGLTHDEAARRLSCPLGTVRSRLARGRDLLRSRLERRGIAPTASLFATALVPEPGRPETLIASTAHTAARLVVGRSLARAVPASVETLVAGVTRTMALTKIGLIGSFLAVPFLGMATLATRGAGPLPAVKQQKAVIALKEPQKTPAVAVAALMTSDQEQPNSDAADEAFQRFPSVVVKTVPATVATNVDPSVNEIQVTFSKDMMDGSWSWAYDSKVEFPEVTGKPSYAKDKRTCVLPVKLEPGKTYAIWLNSPKFDDFKDVDGRPAVPYLLLFRTKDVVKGR